MPKRHKPKLGWEREGTLLRLGEEPPLYSPAKIAAILRGNKITDAKAAENLT